MRELRAAALALRDLTEGLGAHESSLTWVDGTALHFSSEDGCHLTSPAGGTLDLTEWIDDAGLIPAEGVESVRDQFVTRAAVAEADACS